MSLCDEDSGVGGAARSRQTFYKFDYLSRTGEEKNRASIAPGLCFPVLYDFSRLSSIRPFIGAISG